MKKCACYVHLFCLCAFFLFQLSCSDRIHRVELLDGIDSLINENPDSAIKKLNVIESQVGEMGEMEQMCLALYKIKAYDKADLSLTAVKDIVPVINFFEKAKDAELLAMAYYYAGRVSKEKGDVVRALNYFYKAEEAYTRLKNLPMLSVVHSQIGWIFNARRICSESRHHFLKAYEYDDLLNDTLGMVEDLRDLAISYVWDDNEQEALEVMKRAHGLAWKKQLIRKMLEIEKEMAYTYKDLGMYDSAFIYIQQPLLNLNLMEEPYSVYNLLSLLYLKAGDADSATFYAKKLLRDQDLYGQNAAHKILTEMELMNGNEKSALHHFKNYYVLEDSIHKRTVTDAIVQANSLYNYQLFERENFLLKAKNQSKFTWLVIITSVLAIVLFLSVIYFQNNNKKQLEHKLQYEKLERIFQENKHRTKQYVERNNLIINKLEEDLKSVSSENKDLRLQLESERDRLLVDTTISQLEIEKHDRTARMILDSDIYKVFNHLARQKMQLPSKEQWETLRNLLNTHYSSFLDRLNDINKLSDIEEQVCMLVKLEMKPVDIASLTARSQSTVSSIRTRLFKKFFGKNSSPQEWDNFIQTF